MVTTVFFQERLQKIMSYYQISAAQFAEKMGVQRSSISHIISGRNKPSLEFVLKLTEAFPEVDLYWLLKGIGTFPSRKKNTAPPPQTKTQQPETKTQTVEIPPDAKPIERIVIFYTNGSFKSFKN